MKQLKDKKFREYTIKIDKLIERFKDGNMYESKEKLLCVSIEKLGGFTTSTTFKDNKKGRKELLNFIKKECYL
jgi:hypothetical protein